MLEQRVKVAEPGNSKQWLDLGQRIEYESPLGDTWMWDLQLRARHHDIPVNKNIQVQGARPPSHGIGSITPMCKLNLLEVLKQALGLKRSCNFRHSIDVAGLVAGAHR
jgi:hypothetical protein